MSDNIIDIGNEILKQVDIVDIISSFIKVSKKGRNYVAICPFHDDHDPSLSISKEKQIFKCFVCQTSGNAITFVKKYKNCSYFDAVKIVAQIAGIKDDRLNRTVVRNEISDDLKKVYSCLTDISKDYSGFLYQTEEGRNSGLKYLTDRGLSEDVIDRFKIGYALKDGDALPNILLEKGYSLKTIEKTGIGLIYGEKIKDNNAGRVIFSIMDADGQVVGFSARQIVTDKNQGKYINSPETEGGVFHKSNILYNYYNAKDEARRSKFVYIVEGFMDAIAVDRVGIHNVVALMGTAFTKDHIRLLRFLNCEVRLCLDNDGPGQDAMIKICRMLDGSDIKYRLVSNSQVVNGKDSDEILKNGGPDALKNYLNNLLSEGVFILNYYSKKLDLSNLANKKVLLTQFIPFLAKITDPVDVEFYTQKLSQLTGFSLAIITSQVKSFQNKSEQVNTDDTVIDDVEVNFPKKDRDLTRLELSERQIVGYMLENKEAVKEYDLKLGYLVNDKYREIANLIEQYVENQQTNTYSVNDLINYISGYSEDLDEKKKDEIIDVITSISLNDYKTPPYSIESFDDCVKVINEKKEWHRSYDAYNQGSIGKSEEEKAKQAKALLEKRRELIIQREKGNK
jgi:DNA primase